MLRLTLIDQMTTYRKEEKHIHNIQTYLNEINLINLIRIFIPKNNFYKEVLDIILRHLYWRKRVREIKTLNAHTHIQNIYFYFIQYLFEK